jgi:hypothetical protein
MSGHRPLHPSIQTLILLACCAAIVVLARASPWSSGYRVIAASERETRPAASSDSAPQISTAELAAYVFRPTVGGLLNADHYPHLCWVTYDECGVKYGESRSCANLLSGNRNNFPSFRTVYKSQVFATILQLCDRLRRCG